MKTVMMIFCAIGILAFGKVSAAVEGMWTGVLDMGVIKLTLVFTIAPDLETRLGCIEQGFADLPVGKASVEGASIILEMASLKASFRGALAPDEMIGKFTQGGVSYPLTLKRGEAPAALELKRPQEPRPPYPYQEEEVQFAADGAVLSGTLTMPENADSPPAVILIAGTGPHTRDEVILGHKPFLVLADHLTRQGFAVLRFDKRGCGKSSGLYETSSSEDFAKDTLAAVEFLKSRADINTKKIGLIGHSEGGMIGPMVAAKSPDVAFIVMMAGTGVSGEEILYRQGELIHRALGVSEEEIASDQAFRQKVFAILKSTPDPTEAQGPLLEIITQWLSSKAPAAPQEIESNPAELVKAMNTAWWRFFLIFDPASALSSIQIPILVLNGELDLQVCPQQNLGPIAEALQKGGNRHFTIVKLPKTNHLFQTCETGSLTEYGKIEETISPKVLDLISEWVKEQTSKL